MERILYSYNSLYKDNRESAIKWVLVDVMEHVLFN